MNRKVLSVIVLLVLVAPVMGQADLRNWCDDFTLYQFVQDDNDSLYQAFADVLQDAYDDQPLLLTEYFSWRDRIFERLPRCKTLIHWAFAANYLYRDLLLLQIYNQHELQPPLRAQKAVSTSLRSLTETDGFIQRTVYQYLPPESSPDPTEPHVSPNCSKEIADEFFDYPNKDSRADVYHNIALALLIDLSEIKHYLSWREHHIYAYDDCDPLVVWAMAIHNYYSDVLLQVTYESLGTDPPADILQARDNSVQRAELHYRLTYERTTWASYAAEE